MDYQTLFQTSQDLQDISFQELRSPVAQEIMDEANTILQEKFPGKFLTYVPLGSAVLSWMFRRDVMSDCGSLIGDVDFGIIIDCKEEDIFLIRLTADRVLRSIVRNYGLHTCGIVAPQNFYFNLGGNTFNSYFSLAEALREGYASYVTALPFMQDDAEIARRAYAQLIAEGKGQNIVNIQTAIINSIFGSWRNLFTPREKHTIRTARAPSVDPQEDNKLLKIYADKYENLFAAYEAI